MGGAGAVGADCLKADARAPGSGVPALWDRFAHWPRLWARAALALLVLLLVASAWVPLTVGRGEVAKVPTLALGHETGKTRPRDDDLALYDRAITRIRHGENYYSFIVAEHRRAHYPVRPGLAVRLPTLAYVDAWAGVDGDAPAPLAMGAAVLLMGAVIWAWWRRLGDEGCSEAERRYGTALMFLGASLGLNRYYFVLHELWAGMLIALAFGLHRPGRRFFGAWLAAALALAIREHTLPFVLLLGAQAGWRWLQGDRAARAETLAWGALVALFGAGLAVHLHLIGVQALPTDPVGPSWFAMRGLHGWLSDVVLASNLRFLPHWLAGPLVILMLAGWAGWRSAAGLTGFLLYAGYGAAFMIAGRDDNFYWGAVVAPAMFVGLAFVPMAVASLVKAALATETPAR